MGSGLLPSVPLGELSCMVISSSSKTEYLCRDTEGEMSVRREVFLFVVKSVKLD